MFDDDFIFFDSRFFLAKVSKKNNLKRFSFLRILFGKKLKKSK